MVATTAAPAGTNLRGCTTGRRPPPIRPEDMVAEVDTRRVPPDDEYDYEIHRHNWYGGGA